MSLVRCHDCNLLVDSDDDPEVFVEIGDMKRLHKEIILCERCRELRGLEMDNNGEWQYMEETK